MSTLRSFAGTVIACNAYWFDCERAPDYLVCLDADQIERAARWVQRTVASTRLVVPRDGTFSTRPDRELLDSLGEWVVEMPELTHAATQINRKGGLIGAFAGQVAFQLAMHLAPRLITLVGVDVSGRMNESGRVSLSSVPAFMPGYESQEVAVSECVQLAGGLRQPTQPDGWRSAVQVWRSLIAEASARGIKVERAEPFGALDFVPASGDVDGD